MNNRIYWIGLVILITVTSVSVGMQKLKIGPNNRFLAKEDGEPFVWIGETNWFFAKLPPNTIDLILEKRSRQGFTVMFVSCRESLYNGAGGPGGINSPNEIWWSYLDDYVEKAEKKNLYVGITLGWWGTAKRNNAKDLYYYGKWVGNRYKDSNNVVWLTLGESGSYKRKDTISDVNLSSLVTGIRDGDTGNKLLTIHADYRRGTSISNDGDLCDFNNWQTSQWNAPTDLARKGPKVGGGTVWDAITYDYNKMYDGKPKPTLDSEAKYENNKDFAGATAFTIRRRAYYTIFAGAFGHTYGAGGIWDGLSSNEGVSKNALGALNYPGAEDMGHLSSFLHGLGDDILKMRPDQNIIRSPNSDSYDNHIQASVASDRSFALVYSASDAPYTLDLTRLRSKYLSARWYNPSENTFRKDKGSSYNHTSSRKKFDPPGDIGAGHDWVLVLGK